MEPTACGRLAAVVRETTDSIYHRFNRCRLPDFADYRDALEVHVAIELANARLEEARLKPENGERVLELLAELVGLFARAHVAGDGRHILDNE